MNKSHYGFVCPVHFSIEINIRVRKKINWEFFLRKNRYQVFVPFLKILPIRQIIFQFLFASFGIHKLFLFLFVQKLAPQIYSYSYSQETLLFADHWKESSWCNESKGNKPHLISKYYFLKIFFFGGGVSMILLKLVKLAKSWGILWCIQCIKTLLLGYKLPLQPWWLSGVKIMPTQLNLVDGKKI